MEYISRDYRQLFRQGDMVHFQVAVQETDLDIGVRRDRFTPDLVAWVEAFVQEQRQQLQAYIQRDPIFRGTLLPHRLQPEAPPLAVAMAESARLAGVGPMAAVAGAFAQVVGEALAKRSREVIVENGGDIYIRTVRTRKIGIFAGQSPFSNRIALEIQPFQSPLGVCTSSGTVGPSLSLGNADAVVILASSAMLADAAASAAANVVKEPADVEQAVEVAKGITGVTGVLAIKDDKLAVWGEVKLVPM